MTAMMAGRRPTENKMTKRRMRGAVRVGVTAGESGTLGSVGELGSSSADMQDHVTALQKNLATLQKVKAALGG